jgi:hypothetical protein
VDSLWSSSLGVGRGANNPLPKKINVPKNFMKPRTWTDSLDKQTKQEKIKARRMRWVGHVARTGEPRNAYRLLVAEPDGRRPLGRPRRRWSDNIRMDLVEVGWGDVDWIGLAQDRDRWRTVVSSELNLQVPQTAGKLSSVQTTRDLSSTAHLHGVS